LVPGRELTDNQAGHQYRKQDITLRPKSNVSVLSGVASTYHGCFGLFTE